MNILTAIFGDPAVEQAALTKKFEAELVRLRNARRFNDKAAELAALQEMQLIAGHGSIVAKKHLANVENIQVTIDSVGKFTSKTKNMAMFAMAVFALYIIKK